MFQVAIFIQAGRHSCCPRARVKPPSRSSLMPLTLSAAPAGMSAAARPSKRVALHPGPATALDQLAAAAPPPTPPIETTYPRLRDDQQREGTPMRAWTVDADDIRVAEDFDESLLHRTPEIDGFLTPDRDDKFIVIGTKGFGKTLLLKAKRILYQRAGPRDLPAERQPARQADRRQDLQPRIDRVLRRLAAAVVEGLARRDRGGRAEAGRRDRRPASVGAAARRPDRRCATAQRDRPFRAPARLHAERAAALRDRDRRSPGAAPARAERAARDLHRRHRRVLQQARRGRPVQPERDRRAVAERLVLRAARPGRGGLPAAPHQPPPEGLRGDPQGSLCAAAAAHRDGPAVPRQRGRHRLFAGEPARDLRQQHPPGQRRSHGPARAPARPSARGLSRPRRRDRHLHARGGGRIRVRLPPHAAAATRPDDDRRPAGRAATRRTAQRAPAEGSREPGRQRDRARVPERDRAVHRRPRAGPPVPSPARADPDARRSRGAGRPGRRRGRRRHRRTVRALPRRPARLRAARPRARRVATALPAAWRGDVRVERQPAARDPLPRPPGAVGSDRPVEPGVRAALRPHQHHRLRPPWRETGGAPTAAPTSTPAAC